MYFLCVTGIKYSRLEKRGRGRIQEVLGNTQLSFKSLTRDGFMYNDGKDVDNEVIGIRC